MYQNQIQTIPNYNNNYNYGYNYGYMPQQMQYDRLAGLQNFQQQIQQPQAPSQIINGKVVDSLEVVKATDIPMDGATYYFPKADGTEIYSKRWLPNGQTQVTSYKPILDSLGADTSNLSDDNKKEQIGALQSVTDDILKRIDDRFDKIEKTMTMANKRSINSKKELDNE